ncbi:MAG TPA: TonB-dependent receptor [Blastocatellia bacterium]|nr:TonB-dependent receptor [Blastocatellia bacterium]
MKRGAKLLVVSLTIALVAIQCQTAQAASFGVLRGVVRDQYGLPLVGATVAIFDAKSKADKPVRDTLTNETGEFAAQIAPGRYLLRAVAAGFSSFEARARVAANQETVLDSIALRRANTLADRARIESKDPYRQVVRTSRGHVFHLDQTDDDETRDLDNATATALTDRDNAAHGVVQTVAATGSADYVATNFAVAREVAGSQLTVAGQLGAGENAPMRLEAATSTPIGNRHDVNLAVGFGRAPAEIIGTGTQSELDQFTVQAVDRWQVLGRLVLLYGLNYTKYSGASNASTILPRLGVEFSPTNRTQVFARLTPGSTDDVISQFDTESGVVRFVEPVPIAVSSNGSDPIAGDRSRRCEIGFSHLFDERSNVEVMAFYDVASGRGIGFLSVPASGGDSEFRTGSLDGRSTGVRVLYTRRLTNHLSGSAGYSTGRGLELDPSALLDPATPFDSTAFQLFAGQLEADFASGTRISAVYRFSPNSVVFAIDPFDGRLSAYQPGASFLVTQSIPMPGFMPGRWEALLDIRNVFDNVPVSEDNEVSLVEYSRLIRAGVSFRF